MKKIIPILLLAFTSVLTYAMEDDSTRIKMGNSTLIIVKNEEIESKNFDYDFTSDSAMCTTEEDKTTMIVEFGLNGYLAPDFKTTLPNGQELAEIDYSRSRSFGIAFAHSGVDIVKKRLYFSYGLGLHWNNYKFENGIKISTDNDFTAFTSDTVTNYDKYKLRTTYLELPLVLGVRIGKLSKPVGLQLGATVGYKVNSALISKYTINGSDYKTKVKDNFNINPFRADAIARVTFGDAGFFARYSVTSLFEDGKGYELNPFSVGVVLGGFSVKDKKK